MNDSPATECSRKGKWLGGCKFEERADLSPADISSFTSISGMGTGAVLERLRKKTYVKDVCVTCGKTIERNAS